MQLLVVVKFGKRAVLYDIILMHVFSTAFVAYGTERNGIFGYSGIHSEFSVQYIHACARLPAKF